MTLFGASCKFSRMCLISYLTLLFLSISPVYSLYGSGDDVIELTSSNFDKVYSSDSVWFVEFYAPWCGHCKNLAPEWKRAAKILKGIVNIAAVDAEANRDLGGQFNIKGFPTIIMFTLNKRSAPAQYTGERTYKAIVNEALRQAKLLAEARMGGQSSDSSGSSSSDVVELTDSNFDEIVLKSEEPWLVEFFAPWCGHCKNLKPHWERAATELKGTVKLGAVDATVHNRLSQKYGISGFPTIKFFPAGPKRGDPVDYDGGRTSSDIVTWAQDKADSLLPPPELLEITSADVLKDACENHPICVISVMPDLYDCQAECRNGYLNVVKKESERLKKQKWGWLWAAAVAQPDMEEKLNIGGSGYPAMVAVNIKKKKYTTLLGPFSGDGIHEFLRSLSLGDSSLPSYTLHAMPTIEQVEPWNGEDAPPLEPEEEIDLSELGRKQEL